MLQRTHWEKADESDLNNIAEAANASVESLKDILTGKIGDLEIAAIEITFIKGSSRTNLLYTNVTSEE